MQISGYGNSSMLQQMQAMRSQMFQKSDADQSGGLSIDEFKSAGQNMPPGAKAPQDMPKAEDMFAKLDTNGDGNLTSGEMEAMKPPFDTQGMSTLLGVQESGQAGGGQFDLVNSLLDALKAIDDKKEPNAINTSGSSSSSQNGVDQILSRIMDQALSAYKTSDSQRTSTLSLAA